MARNFTTRNAVAYIYDSVVGYENIVVYYSDSVVGRENFKTFSRPATLSHIHTTALWVMKIL